MQLQNLNIRTASAEDVKTLEAFVESMGHVKDPEYFARQYEYQTAGERIIFLADYEDVLAGYCILNWQPKYAFFKKMGFPEIQDLNVYPKQRRQGIATVMIAHCENRAHEKGLEYMGIAVGVHSGFGPAQILYANLGYIPDGNGATYDRQLLAFGEFRPIDDDLCLMMVKKLENQG